MTRFHLVAGSLARADDTQLVSVVVTDPLAVEFDVDEKTVLAIRRAIADGAGKLAVEVGLSDEDGFPHAGALSAVDPAVDPRTGTIRFRASYPNPDGLVIPGMTARVRLTVPGPK